MTDLMERMRQLAGIVESRPMYQASLSESVQDPLLAEEPEDLIESLQNDTLLLALEHAETVEAMEAHYEALQQELQQAEIDAHWFNESPERYSISWLGRELSEAFKSTDVQELEKNKPPKAAKSPAEVAKGQTPYAKGRIADLVARDIPSAKGEVARHARTASRLMRVAPLKHFRTKEGKKLTPSEKMAGHLADYERRSPESEKEHISRLAAQSAHAHRSLVKHYKGMVDTVTGKMNKLKTGKSGKLGKDATAKEVAAAQADYEKLSPSQQRHMRRYAKVRKSLLNKQNRHLVALSLADLKSGKYSFAHGGEYGWKERQGPEHAKGDVPKLFAGARAPGTKKLADTEAAKKAWAYHKSRGVQVYRDLEGKSPAGAPLKHPTLKAATAALEKADEKKAKQREAAMEKAAVKKAKAKK